MHVCMHMHGCTDVRMYGCMDVWMYGCMDVWMYGCMDVAMTCEEQHIHQVTVTKHPETATGSC